jgi:predicted nucleic acid-binding protein
MSILVDSSIWIDYLRRANHSQALDRLIDNNELVVNDLILAELIPALMLKRQQHLIKLLKAIRRLPLCVDWDDLIKMQVKCLGKGINKVGIPDLIIAQNSIQNKAPLYTRDKHFQLLSLHIPLLLFME